MSERKPQCWPFLGLHHLPLLSQTGMRFSIFVSSTFVLAGMSAALPVGRADMLVARFADSDFLTPSL
ncbi:hypothetical protein M378DRAFT_171863 [Amanita muscaria Koide BX008]|uniref:Uncharacterized protein n=1 Tax=Amanita muscaria (strain Koide BX008) TaxID=946122 RepID=A0A0C2WMC5_AMAMK|nr:hypothetical protein M378DRAFT_171863 [Amanita muscaria Koide BX008]